MLDQQQTVANVVLDHSECAQVFQRHRIDFCCRGDLTVAEAAEGKGIDVDALVSELSEAIDTRHGARPDDPRALSTVSLIAHIVSRHHDYLRRTLPFVGALAAKVGRVHGDHNPKLRELHAAVAELVDKLLPHLDQEEQQLFPALSASTIDPARVARELGAMTADHLAVAILLGRIRAAAEDFTTPDWACMSYRTLFSELEQLERDVFTHVHLENHVLKPRFAAA